MWADLVLVDGNILTLDSSQPSAEAVAIKEDRIVKVGTNEEIRQWIGDDTKVIDLQGRTVVPGLTDSHIHVGDFGKFLTWVDLTDTNSVEEMQRIIRERAQKISKGRWIIGSGWNQTRFAEKRYPNRRDLDEASPHNPVILYHQCGRVCVVNSKALELAGVTNETRPPSGGEIEKDAETGEPTGILRETATDLVWKIVPEPSEEELMEGASLACKKIVEAGVTSIHWIVASLTEIQVIQKLRAENKLPLRVYIIVPATFLDQIIDLGSSASFGENKDRNLGVKIFVDGSLAARTAALREPYSDSFKSKGELLYSQQELNKLVAKVHKANFRLVMHAMGDQAIDMALTAIEKALVEEPRKNHRYRLEHASVLNRELIHSIKELGMIVSVQPKCVITEFSEWSAVERLGSARARLLYPLKTLIEEGVPVVGGSDCPMEPLSPLQGIQAAVTRPFFPEEQITFDEALRMYTVNAAYASFEETVKGTIEEGKLADLTVLSDDPTAVSPSRIGGISVYMTIVGGKVVYQS
ncbi:MAG TPA: amidohydrolase [Candidatus Bathyarchaeota archaeon]|nr:amidohydrolase [Candidatus Bathyarchaeota archaeon]